MQMTLTRMGSKCRVCTNPDRAQIESMLARGTGIAAIRLIVQDAFSPCALYRHRAKHMIAKGMPAARPVPFPHDGSPVERIKWLQREAELTPRWQNKRDDLSAKIKVLNELSRLIWLELRSNREEKDSQVAASYQEDLERMGQQALARFEEGRAQREAALEGNPIDHSTHN